MTVGGTTYAKLFGKSLCWLVLMVLFSLAQLWIIIAYQYHIDSEKITTFLFIKDGALHFFCFALITSLTLDFWFDPISNDNINWFKKIAFVFVPLILLIFICVNYLFMYLKEKDVDQNVIVHATVLFTITTILFSLVVKLYLFYEQLIAGEAKC